MQKSLSHYACAAKGAGAVGRSEKNAELVDSQPMPKLDFGSGRGGKSGRLIVIRSSSSSGALPLFVVYTDMLNMLLKGKKGVQAVLRCPTGVQAVLSWCGVQAGFKRCPSCVQAMSKP